jgi:flavin reductase (DIM6/NTAB) family NADH-FMN oxidoreductase RutF
MTAPADPTEFRRCCAKFATGICVAGVVTADGVPHGLTVNSFTSVSLDPPMILICLNHASGVIDWFRQSEHFGISILEEAQQGISGQFAQRGHDRFNGVAWHRGETGVPLLDNALGSMECRVSQMVRAGDHDVFIADVVRATTGSGRPLIYFDSGYRSVGP